MKKCLKNEKLRKTHRKMCKPLEFITDTVKKIMYSNWLFVISKNSKTIEYEIKMIDLVIKSCCNTSLVLLGIYLVAKIWL